MASSIYQKLLCGVMLIGGAQTLSAQRSVYVTRKSNPVTTAVVRNVDKIDFIGGKALLYSGVDSTSFKAADVLNMSWKEAEPMREVVMPEKYRADFDFEIEFSDADKALASNAEPLTADTAEFVENSVWANQITITYGGTEATVSGTADSVNIEVKGNHVVVKAATKLNNIEYILNGSTENGSFKIYTERKSKLTLDGVSITNPTGPAINNQSKKRLYVVLNEGTENYLADGATYTKVTGEDQRGCMFSEGQICLSGTGSLTVEGNKKSAIASDQYIHMISGYVKAISHAAKGKSVYAKDNIILGGGALQALADGVASKAVTSDSLLYILGGKLTAITTGDAVWDEDKNDYASSTCLKCDNNMVIKGGEIRVLATGVGGKGISAGSTIEKNGKETQVGTLTIDSAKIYVRTAGKRIPEVKSEDAQGNKNEASASPKGMKAADKITINSGEIYVRCGGGAAAEGIESKKTININGGKIRSYCVDDGMNGEGAYIKGGDVFICSTSNDGFDVSFLQLSGGELYTIGGAVDQMGMDTDGKTFIVNGGKLTAIGANNCTPFAKSTQACVMIYMQKNVKYIQVVDADGNVVKTVYTPNDYVGAKNLDGKVGKNMTLLVSDEGILVGKTYKVLSYESSLEDVPTVEYEFTPETTMTTAGTYSKY